MNAQIELIPGTNRDLSKSQYFTPPDLAAKVVEWARVTRGQYEVRGEGMMAEGSYRPMRVLEPSAGNGALVRPLVAAGAEVHAIELDERYGDELRGILGGPRGCAWIGDSFLEFKHYNAQTFDLCVMNPPYENGQDVAFILHALKFASRVVGIFQAAIEYGVDRVDDLWSVVRPTRMLKLKRRWFKDPATKGGGQTNYVVLELVKRSRCDADDMCRPDNVTMEWW